MHGKLRVRGVDSHGQKVDHKVVPLRPPEPADGDKRPPGRRRHAEMLVEYINSNFSNFYSSKKVLSSS